LETAQDGVKPRFKNVPPRWVVPQKTPSDERKAKLMKGKIQKVLDRGYIGPGRVTSLMNVFDVPKDDIRLVYDGTTILDKMRTNAMVCGRVTMCVCVA